MKIEIGAPKECKTFGELSAVDRDKVTKQVKVNAMKLDRFLEENPLFVKKNKGKFVIFNDNVTLLAKDLKNAMRFGNESFGETTGFVVRQIGTDEPVLSKRNRNRNEG